MSLLRKKTKKMGGSRQSDFMLLESEYDFLDEDELGARKTERSGRLAVQEEEEKVKLSKLQARNRFRGRFTATLLKLPPPFALIDHLVFLLKRSWTNSLAEFYSEFFT